GKLARKRGRDTSIQRDPPVERHRHLYMDKRPEVFMPADELLVNTRCFFGDNPRPHFDTAFAKALEADSRNEWVWIFDRSHDPRDAGVDQGFGARWCSGDRKST